MTHQNLRLGKCWKRKCSFISTVRPTVHTNPLREQSFSKTLVKLALHFIACGKHFENAGFRQRWWLEDRESWVFLQEISLSTDLKSGVFKFLRFDERFRKTPFSWRLSVDGRPNRRNKAADADEAIILAFATRAVKFMSLFVLWMFNAYNQFIGLSNFVNNLCMDIWLSD